MPEWVWNLLHTVAELTQKLPDSFAVLPSCTANAGSTQRGYPEEEVWEVPGQRVTTWDGDRCHQCSQRQDLEYGSGGQSPHEATQCHQAQVITPQPESCRTGQGGGKIKPKHSHSTVALRDPCLSPVNSSKPTECPHSVTHSSVPAAPRPSPGSRTGWALAAWWGARTGAAAPRRQTVGHKHSWVRQGTHPLGKNLRANRATETRLERALHEPHRSPPSPAEKANSFIPVSQTGNREIKWLVCT